MAKSQLKRQDQQLFKRIGKMKNICVYCGSSPGKRPEYTAAACELAEQLVKSDIGLVYGGASIGVMGAIADAVLNAGGRVTGIIPESLAEKEVLHTGVTELRIVKSMHERKALMAELSDGFIALPGGLGTLEELFEILTWAQLGLHRKPCVLLNINGYYNGLAAFIDHAIEEQFVKEKHRDLLIITDRPDEALKQMEAYHAPHIARLINTGET